MKKILFVISFLFFTLAISFAGISSEMKSIGSRFKTISLSVSDASKNSVNIILTEKIISSFKVVREISPGNGDQVEFQKLIDQAVSLFEQLKISLNENDNVKAMGILQEINTVRKEAHAKFK